MDWPARPYIAPNTLHVCDALELLQALPDQSADLIATDPPYYKVKKAAWDNAWNTPSAFIEWLGGILDEMQRVLKPNGSLYMFASPKMAARVEVAISERFNVLNRITWSKPPFATKAEMFDKDTMRCYFPASETIIFAEPMASDKTADELAGFTAAETALKKRIFGDYLTKAFDEANANRKSIAALFPSETGGLTGCVSNWVLGYNVPTREQYHAMRDYLNSLNGKQYLRREYEDLRREYEDLRRPFNSSPDKPYTDVWTFPTVGAYPAKHECEKPLDMMKHIVSISSRPNGLVVDPFVGSGNTLLAAQMLGRRFIGGDMSAHWVDIASKRVFPTFGQPPRRKRETKSITELPLFAALEQEKVS